MGDMENSLTTFESLGLDERLCEHLRRTFEISQPTEIQQKAIPFLLEHSNNVFVKSETGSGKTLTFLLPILHQLFQLPVKVQRHHGPLAIILSPRRELALQIYEILNRLLKCMIHIIPGMIIGGEKKKSEKARLRKGVNILIATPGRLLDHLRTTQVLDLSQVRWFVMDEGDLLTDMGFEKDVKQIIHILNERTKLLREVDLSKSSGNFSLDNLYVQQKVQSKRVNNEKEIEIKPCVKEEDDQLVLNIFDHERKKGESEFDFLELKPEPIIATTEKNEYIPGHSQSEEDLSDSEDENTMKDSALLEHIILELPKERQTIVCSATVKESIKELTYLCCTNPIFISANASHDQLKALRESRNPSTKQLKDIVLNNADAINLDDEPFNILTDFVPAPAPTSLHEVDVDRYLMPKFLVQCYLVVPAKQRLVILYTLLRMKSRQKIVVFFSSCVSVDFHFGLFKTVGCDGPSQNNNDDLTNKVLKNKTENDNISIVDQLSIIANMMNSDAKIFKFHGNMDQKERTLVYTQFSKIESGILLCTDVAARGLDLPKVQWIVQYDPASNIDDYIHRVGRTARLGRNGRSVIFLLESEIEYVKLLEEKTEMPVRPIRAETVVLPSIDSYQLLDQLERYVYSTPQILALARSSYLSFVRAYTTHCRSEKHIFHHRKLHFGHIAKSFGLRDPPSKIKSLNAQSRLGREEDPVSLQRTLRKAERRLHSDRPEVTSDDEFFADKRQKTTSTIDRSMLPPRHIMKDFKISNDRQMEVRQQKMEGIINKQKHPQSSLNNLSEFESSAVFILPRKKG